MTRQHFDLGRFWAVLVKEFIQMRRDRLTFAMMVGVPVMQLVLFGYAINTDPKHLPTAAVVNDPGPFARSFLAAAQNTGYFRITQLPASEHEANELLQIGAVQFVLTIPPRFAEQLVRGERPALLVEADATDPAAASNALAALAALDTIALRHDLHGPLQPLASVPTPFEIRVHRRYNPEGISRYNIVPGLLGVVLTMTMVMMTALAMTRERERGTMENLLATPARPIEVMLGKVLPFVVVGYVQVGVILLAARFLFEIPMVGSLTLLSGALILFITANLAVGYTFSTLATTQLQASQMATFFFLPSILLSGFMFPFRGMPEWAQWLGELLPLTHFLRIVRGILLKGNGLAEIWVDLWPLLAFLLAATTIALWRSRETLD
ncbi:MAG: ABC transporter permease [Rhodoplanes sp.]